MRALVLNLPDEHGQNMVKDLFNGAWCRGARIGGTSMPPLTLLYAYTVLQRAGVHVSLEDAVERPVPLRLLAQRVAAVDLLVVHSSAYTLQADRRVLRSLRSLAPDVSVFLFGNLGPEHARAVLADGTADHVCIQDPEEVLVDLVAGLGPGGLQAPVAGLWQRGHDAAARPLGALDSLPVPDRRPLLGRRYRNLLARTPRWTTALTSRGCPFACSFCNTPGYYGRSFRRHSVDYVLAELRGLRALGFTEVFFRDDVFHAGAVSELCEAMIAAKLDLVWSCNHRVDTVSPDDLALMAEAGCHTVKFGVESGDDSTLSAIGKPPSAAARATFDACRRVGLRTHAHLIIGLPGETRASMDATVSLLDQLDPWTFTLNLFTPHPGSALHDQLRDQGRLVSGAWKEDLVGNPSRVSDAELGALLRRTYLRRYLAPRRAVRILRGQPDALGALRSGLQLLAGFALPRHAA